MLKIRLQRVGRKHEPSFRLVLTDSKNSTKSGRFLEVLGSYDPRKNIDAINAERVRHWLSQGAGLTGTVHNLLVTHKIIDEAKINVLPKKTPPIMKTDNLQPTTNNDREASTGEKKEEIEKESAIIEGSEITPTSEAVGVPTDNVGITEADKVA